MSDLSNYAEAKIYDHATGRSAWTMPTQLYLALFTAVTDAEAGTGTEIAVSGYARQAISFGPQTDGAGSNSGALTFASLQGSGTATHGALFDASSAGNPITIIKALGVQKPWTVGDSITVAIGAVTFALA